MISCRQFVVIFNSSPPRMTLGFSLCTSKTRRQDTTAEGERKEEKNNPDRRAMRGGDEERQTIAALMHVIEGREEKPFTSRTATFLSHKLSTENVHENAFFAAPSLPPFPKHKNVMKNMTTPFFRAVDNEKKRRKRYWWEHKLAKSLPRLLEWNFKQLEKSPNYMISTASTERKNVWNVSHSLNGIIPLIEHYNIGMEGEKRDGKRGDGIELKGFIFSTQTLLHHPSHPPRIAQCQKHTKLSTLFSPFFSLPPSFVSLFPEFIFTLTRCRFPSPSPFLEINGSLRDVLSKPYLKPEIFASLRSVPAPCETAKRSIERQLNYEKLQNINQH